jgi:Ni/Co efflux regulator RcnB
VDLNPAGPRKTRRAVLAACVIALTLPTLAAGQTRPYRPPPAALQRAEHAPSPRPAVSDRPYKPSYGRWSPGQVLPPTAGAVVVSDYAQFHLRRPPRGYAWMQCDGDFILANAAGLIFEVIPGGGR